MIQLTSCSQIEIGLNINLPKDLKNLIDNNGIKKTFFKNETILLEGEQASSIYFIISGVVRGYYIDEKGNDITKCFSLENEFFSSEGLRTGSVSSFNIECIEQCECIELSYGLVNRLVKENEEFKSIFLELYLKEVQKLEIRAKSLMIQNAEERYLDFIENSKRSMEKIELKYIASYLGIRPQSLSRIRKKLRDF